MLAWPLLIVLGTIVGATAAPQEESQNGGACAAAGLPPEGSDARPACSASLLQGSSHKTQQREAMVEEALDGAAASVVQDVGLDNEAPPPVVLLGAGGKTALQVELRLAEGSEGLLSGDLAHFEHTLRSVLSAFADVPQSRIVITGISSYSHGPPSLLEDRASTGRVAAAGGAAGTAPARRTATADRSNPGNNVPMITDPVRPGGNYSLDPSALSDPTDQLQKVYLDPSAGPPAPNVVEHSDDAPKKLAVIHIDVLSGKGPSPQEIVQKWDLMLHDASGPLPNSPADPYELKQLSKALSGAKLVVVLPVSSLPHYSATPKRGGHPMLVGACGLLFVGAVCGLGARMASV